MESEQVEKTKKHSALRDMVETVLLTLLIYVLVRTFLFENYRVVGHSMLPTLVDDQFLIVNKLGYRLYEPQRGDIVVFVDPRAPDRKLIKRIIGLPGEVIELRNGQVYVNERLLDEQYIAALGRYSEPPVPVPEGQYYVLGDNRNNSSDSHNWGTLPEDNIVGKAWLSYWPPAAWGVIPHADYASFAAAPVDDPFFSASRGAFSTTRAAFSTTRAAFSTTRGAFSTTRGASSTSRGGSHAAGRGQASLPRIVETTQVIP